MDYKAICGVASYALTVIGLLVYARAIVADSKKPSIATWAIWTLNSFLLPASYYRLGAEQTVWLAAGYATGCVVITFLAIKMRGEVVWTKLERYIQRTSPVLGASCHLDDGGGDFSFSFFGEKPAPVPNA